MGIEQLDKNVKEKYDDYKYNFKDHGLGIIDMYQYTMMSIITFINI